MLSTKEFAAKLHGWSVCFLQSCSKDELVCLLWQSLLICYCVVVCVQRPSLPTCNCVWPSLLTCFCIVVYLQRQSLPTCMYTWPCLLICACTKSLKRSFKVEEGVLSKTSHKGREWDKLAGEWRQSQKNSSTYGATS